MEKFLELMAEILEVEVDEISMNMDFRKEVEDFNSLMGFSMIITMEEDFNTKISVADFLECTTLNDLYNKINSYCNEGTDEK